MTPSRPYLIRALYDWIVDNDCTPYLLVDVEDGNVQIPEEYVEDGKIIVNISPRAIENMALGNDTVVFTARFGHTSVDVSVPIHAVMAIYAKENGQGMMFNKEHDGDEPPEPPENKSGKAKLKLVK